MRECAYKERNYIESFIYFVQKVSNKLGRLKFKKYITKTIDESRVECKIRACMNKLI